VSILLELFLITPGEREESNLDNFFFFLFYWLGHKNPFILCCILCHAHSPNPIRTKSWLFSLAGMPHFPAPFSSLLRLSG
jgi:hypothetical protein